VQEIGRQGGEQLELGNGSIDVRSDNDNATLDSGSAIGHGSAA
jgi:hypothetical protein